MYWLFNEDTCVFEVTDETALSDLENIVIRSDDFDFEIHRQGKKRYWREDENLEVFGNIFYREEFELILNRITLNDYDDSALTVRSR